MGKMDTINHLKIDPAVLPAAHCAASRKKSRKPRIFCQLINSKFRDLAVKIPSSTLAISRTFPTGLLLLRMISTNQFNDAGGVLEIPFITEDMAQKSLNKLTSNTIQK